VKNAWMINLIKKEIDMARHDKEVSLPALPHLHRSSGLYASGQKKPVRTQKQVEQKTELTLPFLSARGSRKVSNSHERAEKKRKHKTPMIHEVQILQIIEREVPTYKDTAEHSTQTYFPIMHVDQGRVKLPALAEPRRLPVPKLQPVRELDQKPSIYFPPVSAGSAPQAAKPSVPAGLQRFSMSKFIAEFEQDCQKDFDERISACTNFFDQINARRQKMLAPMDSLAPITPYSARRYSASEDEERSALSTPSLESRKTV
jgi:hypothetical protein